MDKINAFDFGILDYIYANMHTGFLDTVMPFVSSLANAGRIWILLAFVLLIVPKTRKIGAALALALVLDFVVVNLIMKNAFCRIRPFDINTAVELLVKPPRDYSFPSGHTAASFASAAAIFCCNRKWGIAALVFAAIIAFSRLYLYVHYPTDVLAGAVTGIIIGILSAKLINSKAAEKRLFSEIPKQE